MTGTAITNSFPKNVPLSTTSNNGHSTTKKTNGKRKSASLPSETVEYLKAWMMSAEHIAHPYPTEQEKVEIMKDTGIELKQLTNWFVNNRKRYWKPRVEARLQQQAQAAQAAVQAHAAAVAAVSTGCGTVAQQGVMTQQVSTPTGTTAAVKATRANLVSPNAGFKSLLKLNGNDIAIQQPLFASPLTFAAQILEQRNAVQSSTMSAASETSNSVASVSASEGEISDSSPDDASSDDAAIVGTDLKFFTRKSLKFTNTSRPSSPTSTPTRSHQERTTAYTRNVSFCSLEQVSGGSEFSAPQESGMKEAVESTSSYDTLAPRRKRHRPATIDAWMTPSLEEASRMFGYSN